jgi:type VI secretion system protein ImpF
MASKQNQERILPCLLDRLVDADPRSSVESRSGRVFNMTQYRDAVLRDLAFLFNTPSHAADSLVWDYPEAASSVANYGFRNLCGCTLGSLDVTELERLVAETIRNFEPRIMPHTLQVRVVPDYWDKDTFNLEIEGDLWAYPVPERLWLRTVLDLDTGRITIGDRVP